MLAYGISIGIVLVLTAVTTYHLHRQRFPTLVEPFPYFIVLGLSGVLIHDATLLFTPSIFPTQSVDSVAIALGTLLPVAVYASTEYLWYKELATRFDTTVTRAIQQYEIRHQLEIHDTTNDEFFSQTTHRNTYTPKSETGPEARTGSAETVETPTPVIGPDRSAQTGATKDPEQQRTE